MTIMRVWMARIAQVQGEDGLWRLRQPRQDRSALTLGMPVVVDRGRAKEYCRGLERHNGRWEVVESYS